MSRTTCLAAFAFLIAACAPKTENGEAAAEGGYADSMAVAPMDSATASTDPAAMAGTVPASPAAVRDSATKAAMTSKSGAAAKSPEAMGRDSAFGPSFMVDSAGKLVPLPKKKP